VAASDSAAAGLQAGSAIGSTVGGLAAAAGAANAVPIAGQVVGAALGLAAILTKLFAGKGPAGKRRKANAAAEEFMRQRHENLKSFQAPQPQQMPTQAAPGTQGMGAFQQFQQTPNAPIYSSGGGAQPEGAQNGG